MKTNDRQRHAKHGSALFIALASMGIGLAVAATMTAFMVHRFITYELPPADKLILEWAEKHDRQNEPIRAFVFYSHAIDMAATPQHKNTAIIAMINFLLKDDPWRPARQRHHMAAEYALTLAKRDLSDNNPVDLATIFLQLASTLRDNQWLEHANRFLAMIRNQGNLPFDLNRLEFQVFFDRGYAAQAYASLDTLKATSEIGEQQTKALQNESRLLWRLLTKESWFNALSGHFEGQTPSRKREQITQRLIENASALTQSDNQAITQESLIMLAKIAIMQGNTKAAIIAFEKAAYNAGAPGQKRAAEKLLVLLRQDVPIEDVDAARLTMFLDPNLQEAALIDLVRELASTTDTARQDVILSTLDAQLAMLKKSGEPIYKALIAAAGTAMQRDERDRAERYLAAAADRAGKTTDQARQLVLQAELAARRGDRDAQVEYLYRLIALNGDKQLDTQARYNLLDALAAIPMATADLVGSAIDATMRFPQDERTTEGLIITARQLEDLSLHTAAEAYYRQAVLLGTMLRQTDGSRLLTTGQAMLGQARVLLKLDREQEADTILRTLNSHSEWAGIWPDAGPLWAAIAMRQGQHKEAIRRWRQTCGPSADSLLPSLFEILVPEFTKLTIQPTNNPRPPPAGPPNLLMLATADAAIERLLEDDAYVRIDQLLSEMEQHAHWRSHLPLEQYRIKTLTRMLAKEPAATVMAWMDQQAISEPPAQAGDLLLSTEALRDWIEKTDRLSVRARTTIL